MHVQDPDATRKSVRVDYPDPLIILVSGKKPVPGANGPIPAAVAALTHSIIRSLLMTRLKFATATILAVAALASLGAAAVVAARIDDPKPPPTSPSAAPIARGSHLPFLVSFFSLRLCVSPS